MLTRPRAPRPGLPAALNAEALALMRADPTLRMLCLALMLFGAFASSGGIYQSLIAVTQFGFSDAQYSLIMLVVLVVAVGSSVGIGILTDQRSNRRTMAILAAGSMTVGAALMLLAPSRGTFLLTHAVLPPFSSALFGQIFAVARLVVAPQPRERRDGVLTTIRAGFALPFVVVLPLWSLAFAAGMPLLGLYAGLLLFSGALLLLVLRRWPRDIDAPWTEQKSGLGFAASMREMLHLPVLIRVMLIGAIHLGGTVQGVLVGLLFDHAPNRSTADVGLFFALFVAFEIITTVQVYRLLRHMRRLYVIAVGVGIVAVYIAALPPLADTPAVWALVVPAGVGGGLVYALAIGYLQDLLGKRAGAGASLTALQRISADGLSAAIFAIGTALAGYWLVAVLAAIGMVAAMAAILWLDRYSPLDS